jgi:hypothetical protein
MNKEQQELLDETYKNYWSNAKNNNLDCLFKQEEGSFLVEMRFYYKEEFINKCKTDSEFSEKWGLQIEERELTDVERYTIARQYGLCPKYSNIRLENCTEEEHYNKFNVPTKLITITYNDKTIESYE